MTVRIDLKSGARADRRADREMVWALQSWRHEMATQLLGWSSSAILIATIGAQLHRQWRSQSVASVSLWLYLGQFGASVGLGIYSVLGQEWVFVALNIVMALAAVVGSAMWIALRRQVRTGATP